MKNTDMVEENRQEKDRFKDLEKITAYKREQQDRKSTVVVEFPQWMIIAILLVVALIFFGGELLTIGIFIFVGFILMSALKPIIAWFMNKGISKGWSITITYVLGFLLIIGISSLVLIPFGKGIQDMVNLLPTLVSDFFDDFKGITIGTYTIDKQWFVDSVSNFTSTFDPSSGLGNLKEVASTVGGVINWVTLVIAIIIFSIYLLSEGDQLVELGLLRISNDRKRERVKKLIEDVESKLGKWLIGQTTVSTIAGVTIGIILALLNVPFALPLGVLVGLFDMIPNIGTTLAIIPSLLIALISGGWTKAVVVLVIYLVYQQVENNFIIPKVMGNAVGLKPIYVMLGIMVFLILFGIWGAFLAVPIMVVSNIVYEFYIDLQKLEAEGIV